eukprot:Opistho-2@17862
MTKVAREEMACSSLDECNVVYFPQIGYLVAVPRKATQQTEEDFHIPGFEFQFVTKNAVHYKSVRTREMDRVLGDIHGDIIDRETEIALTVQSKVLAATDILERTGDLLAELDCLVALATAARDFNYVRPDISTDSAVKIVGGRHPLQELSVGAFIPNNFEAQTNCNRLHVVTGPNASGKSIYIKQVALIVFMAQVGSFVPAESATINIRDRIFTRIQSRESVSVAQSTFMIDAIQVSSVLRSATPRSLVVIDEFGKGTGSGDGVALLAATVRELLRRGSDGCPMCMISTHFYELFTEGLLRQSSPERAPLLKLSHMEVMKETSDLVFLYQAVDGCSTDAHGCRVAAAAGLPDNIVERGRLVSRTLDGSDTIVPQIPHEMAVRFQISDAIVQAFDTFDLDVAPLTELTSLVSRIKEHLTAKA